MMDSKLRSNLKRKSRSPKTEVKSKRSAFSPKQEVKSKKKELEKKLQPKTRWETEKPSPTVALQIQVNASKEEEEQKSHQHHLRIEDMLEDKQKIVEYLFLTVTGTALQELIPDYLKKHSVDELKTLCLSEIQKISPEEILQIISGKQPDEKLKPTIIESDISSRKGEDKVEEIPKKRISPVERLSSAVISDTTESFSNDVLELNPSSNEMKFITDEENQAPISIEEVAKDLYASEKDADIIELEMRARAIMSLLKAKGQDTPDSDARNSCEDE